MVEIVVREREDLNELQADVTGYMLAGVIWSSRSEAHRTWWILPFLKILI